MTIGSRRSSSSCAAICVTDHAGRSSSLAAASRTASGWCEHAATSRRAESGSAVTRSSPAILASSRNESSGAMASTLIQWKPGSPTMRRQLVTMLALPPVAGSRCRTCSPLAASSRTTSIFLSATTARRVLAPQRLDDSSAAAGAPPEVAGRRARLAAGGNQAPVPHHRASPGPDRTGPDRTGPSSVNQKSSAIHSQYVSLGHCSRPRMALQRKHITELLGLKCRGLCLVGHGRRGCAFPGLTPRSPGRGVTLG
jgi:hypothetical protein